MVVCTTHFNNFLNLIINILLVKLLGVKKKLLTNRHLMVIQEKLNPNIPIFSPEVEHLGRNIKTDLKL